MRAQALAEPGAVVVTTRVQRQGEPTREELERDELEGFRAAFAYVVSLAKTEEPVTRYSASW